MWNWDPFRRRLLEVCEEVEEERESSGLKAEFGGSGEGSRCSRLISLYLSESHSLNGADGGRRCTSMGDARNEATADAVLKEWRPAWSQCRV